MFNENYILDQFSCTLKKNTKFLLLEKTYYFAILLFFTQMKSYEGLARSSICFITITKNVYMLKFNLNITANIKNI